MVNDHKLEVETNSIVDKSKTCYMATNGGCLYAIYEGDGVLCGYYVNKSETLYKVE